MYNTELCFSIPQGSCCTFTVYTPLVTGSIIFVFSSHPLLLLLYSPPKGELLPFYLMFMGCLKHVLNPSHLNLTKLRQLLAKPKEQVPGLQTSGVIYKIPCANYPTLDKLDAEEVSRYKECCRDCMTRQTTAPSDLLRRPTLTPGAFTDCHCLSH